MVVGVTAAAKAGPQPAALTHLGTPGPIVEALNREINAVLADPAIKSRLIALGTEPLVMSPAQSAAFVADETGKWGKVIRDAGIKAD